MNTRGKLDFMSVSYAYKRKTGIYVGKLCIITMHIVL
jgi:hypothetical protein